MERDSYMSPEEAKDLGLIDHVLEHPPEPASNNAEDSSEDDKS